MGVSDKTIILSGQQNINQSQVPFFLKRIRSDVEGPVRASVDFQGSSLVPPPTKHMITEMKDNERTLCFIMYKSAAISKEAIKFWKKYEF